MTSMRLHFVLVVAALASLSGCGSASSRPSDASRREDDTSRDASSPTKPAASPTSETTSAVAATGKTKESPEGEATGGNASSGQGSVPGVSEPTSAQQETFPSGLIVDLKLVGGPAPGPELPKGTRVLHVGDSFAGALGIELNKVLRAAGLNAKLEFEQSTYIPTWAHSAKFASLLSTFKPDLVLISLGANELENPEPEKRAPLGQRSVNSIGETPGVWIAPVLWQGAKDSLLQVIRANVGRCVYLDSNEVVKKMPRAGDRIHPSMAARRDWASATARWLAYHRRP